MDILGVSKDTAVKELTGLVSKNMIERALSWQGGLLFP